MKVTLESEFRSCALSIEAGGGWWGAAAISSFQEEEPARGPGASETGFTGETGFSRQEKLADALRRAAGAKTLLGPSRGEGVC